jgi:cytochrome c oxidase subunit II
MDQDYSGREGDDAGGEIVRRRAWSVSGRLLLLAPPVLVLSGCGREQNSLEAHSQQSKDIASLFWWMMGGAWIGLGLIVALLLLSWKRRNRRGLGRDTDGDKPGERPAWYVVVGAGIALPIVLLSTLFVISDLFVIRTTEAPAQSTTKLTVLVIGHQWWWEVRYPASGAVTANELHIPVRTPVRLEVRTADVIHSFWVPELNRKIDTDPGKTNVIELESDRAGRYRGQCAEFCGLQHAHMAMYVFVDSPAAFQRWLAREAKPAAAPSGTVARRGFQEFTSGSCADCHAIRGTSARADVGPDLTHLASRTTLGSVTIDNNRRHLAEWITQSQRIKPGNQMPNIDVTGPRLDALVSYLEGLK